MSVRRFPVGSGGRSQVAGLEALAAVVPMSPQTAAAFERANDEGYFAFDALLLARHSSPSAPSPRALALFETMMLDRDTELGNRVQCLHVSGLPYRTELPVLQAAERILARASERGLVTATVESLFDFRQSWFGIESGISGPPAWRTASTDSLRFAAAWPPRCDSDAT